MKFYISPTLMFSCVAENEYIAKEMFHHLYKGNESRLIEVSPEYNSSIRKLIDLANCNAYLEEFNLYAPKFVKFKTRTEKIDKLYESLL